MDPEQAHRAQLIEKITEILQDNVPPGGLSVAVGSSPSTLTSFCVGQADIIKDEPISSKQSFGIGSITKVFVAVVIFQLVEEGKLHLSDTVAKHVDAQVWHDIDDAETATIAQLLSHTAGVDSWEDDPDWIVHGRGKALKPAHVWGKTETLGYIRRPKKTAPSPGTYYYANTNYTLLGLIIEKVTHNTAEGEIRRRIFEPLGMSSTFLEGFEGPKPGVVDGRYHLATDTFRQVAGVCPEFPEISNGIVDATKSNLSVEWAAGGLVSTTSDLLRFAFALRDSTLLGPKSTAAMRDWHPVPAKAPPSNEMGRGLFRMTLPGARGTWLGHFGGVLGFTAGLWFQEKGSCAVCVLSNVGKMHAGDVPSAVTQVIVASDFLVAASKLASIDAQ
jgi:D-alanyl-D-alanine carboxypeptidase